MATRLSYTDTTTNVRAVGDTIYNIDFQEAALLQLLGFSNKNLSKFSVKQGWPSTKLEILEDVNVPFTSLLAESGFDDTETDMTVTTGTGVYFRKGDIVGIYPTGTTTGVFQEKVLVTAVSGDVLTIVRGYGATSGVAALTGTGLRLITRANEENSIYTTEHMTTPTAPYNYTQILDAAVEMSETEAMMSRYGIDDHMDMQIGKLFDNGGSEGRLAQLLHQTFYYGERVIRAAAPEYGSMGGFNIFCTASTATANHVFDLSSAAIERDDIHKVIRAVRSANGKVTHLVTGAWGIEKIRSMYNNSIRTTQEQRVMGSPQVDEIITPHGSVRVIFDWMCPESEYYFINADKMGWIPFREFTRKTVYGGVENNPYDGRIEKVIGEYTFMLANPKSHGRIYGASTTA
jgi:hypothetical protein